MTRVWSALVLIPLVLGVVCLLPPWATTDLLFVVLTLAAMEFGRLRQAFSLPTVASIGLTVAMFAAAIAADRILPSFGTSMVMVAFGCSLILAGHFAWSQFGVMCVSAIYIGLPLAMLAAIRPYGPTTILWLFAVIVVSDSAQYYTGRAFGRHKLAPVISPKKTIEGAVGGLVIATIAGVVLAHWWLPSSSLAIVAVFTVAIAIAGMMGDLFESMLKRRAGVKDSSSLIPGHGGVLDRIDSWLFAAPVYYVFLRYFA